AIVFATETTGKGVPVEGRDGTYDVESSGTGPKGERVTFESEVVMSDDGFDEVGTIDYAGRGSLKFETIGVGHMAPSLVSGLNHGTVMWRITEGDGEFSGATGLITSNFTFSDQGDLVDNEYVRIFTP
ncbi:MAG: hypothetical protein IH933_17115, partial [Euryarchaeota archaeon]|nr:hypothetical protein [Euryarchaeota archaeon]